MRALPGNARVGLLGVAAMPLTCERCRSLLAALRDEIRLRRADMVLMRETSILWAKYCKYRKEKTSAQGYVVMIEKWGEEALIQEAKLKALDMEEARAVDDGWD